MFAPTIDVGECVGITIKTFRKTLSQRGSPFCEFFSSSIPITLKPKSCIYSLENLLILSLRYRMNLYGALLISCIGT